MRYIGFLTVALGVVMCFAGSKFIFYAFRALIFFIVSGIISGIFYGLGFIEAQSSGKTWAGIVLAVAAGVAVAWCCGAIAEKYTVPILAMFIAGGLTNKALAIVHIRGFVSLVLIIGAMAAAFHYAEKFNKYIKSIGTAIIGAMLLVSGIGMIAAYNDETSVAQIGELAGMAVLAAGGSYVQLKYVAPEDEPEDDMMKEEDM